eukprot:CAMPEP_0177164766 /NCGR_PEP_ID=MMETSP0367-20130122/7125_1 /TAXON_ID=447022 ORGANISM="Scrippsiella hangoei-like, Strain SHHI-4" /NCGR_SAMPLE_ID=MMETSP0367 /ASSEMBLY_ACC=CAM_ASM_000362 /LENGTH=119 /DNA_ID=CAMNT_0018610689 /DNA_START=750 /DNA_END=1107 /DNA_ORIENTATION=+
MTPRAPNANPKANTEKPSITNALLTYAIALPSLEHSLLNGSKEHFLGHGQAVREHLIEGHIKELEGRAVVHKASPQKGRADLREGSVCRIRHLRNQIVGVADRTAGPVSAQIFTGAQRR